MKRHEALTTLSREHHQALILAQLLKKDAPVYKGLPVTVEEKTSYATAFFETDLKLHFEKEEMAFALVKTINRNMGNLVKELIAEHHNLTAMFYSLAKTANPVDAMNTLGELLSSHIRKEERVLFPLLEQCCTGVLLTQIGQLLAKKSDQ